MLRRSMVGRLPAPVVWSRQKEHLGWSFTLEWIDIDPEQTLRDLSSDHPLHDFVDVSAFLDEKVEDDESPMERYLEPACVGLWLEQHSG